MKLLPNNERVVFDIRQLNNFVSPWRGATQAQARDL
jgi:hypothetical protein